MNWGQAFEALKAGAKLQRTHQAEQGVHIEMHRPDPLSKSTQPSLYMRKPDGSMEPWVLSEADMFADDWSIIS